MCEVVHTWKNRRLSLLAHIAFLTAGLWLRRLENWPLFAALTVDARIAVSDN